MIRQEKTQRIDICHLIAGIVDSKTMTTTLPKGFVINKIIENSRYVFVIGEINHEIAKVQIEEVKIEIVILGVDDSFLKNSGMIIHLQMFSRTKQK